MTLIEAGDNRSLIYPVLELRMALESHVYAAAEAYLDELPAPPLAKCQPPALLRELLAIDPHVATTGTLSFARETESGVPGTNWVQIGTQKRMTLKEIDAAYHRLGSFLHIETVLDKADGKIRDFARLREICADLVARLTDIFSTNLHNLVMGVTSTLTCFVCDKPIKRRLNNLKVGDKIVTQCGGDCYATYEIELLPDDKVQWNARFEDISCTQEGGEGTIQIWERHQSQGTPFAATPAASTA